LFVCCIDALAGLSALYIQRRFSNDFVDISDVTMETVAVANSNDLEVFHVENCTCDVASNVAGTHGCCIDEYRAHLICRTNATLMWTFLQVPLYNYKRQSDRLLQAHSLSGASLMIFTARCDANAVYAVAMCPSVRPLQAGLY